MLQDATGCYRMLQDATGAIRAGREGGDDPRGFGGLRAPAKSGVGVRYARDENVPASAPVNDDGEMQVCSQERCSVRAMLR
eukprot:1177756-Prorocentrum_minimum.AAC.1